MRKQLEEKLSSHLKAKEFLEALDVCDELMALGDLSSHLKSVKAWCFFKSDQLDKAEPLMMEAFDEDPSNHKVTNLVISFLMELAWYEKLVAICQRCIAYFPKDRLMWHRLGTAHYMRNELDASVLAFRKSLDVEFSPASAFGISQPLLCRGEYEEGFRFYEFRFVPYPQLNWAQCEKMPMPQWKGEPLNNKKLLIWSEQGLGDSCQFSRFVTEFANEGATVDIMLQQTHKGLLEVLKTLPGVGKVFVVKDKQVSLTRRYDYHSPMMSLMGYYKVRLGNIPAKIPYLSVPDSHPFSWQPKELDAPLKIGIVWTTALTDSLQKSNYMHYALKNEKSLSFSEVEPLLRSMTDAQFYSMHVTLPDEHRHAMKAYNVLDLSARIKSFADTAAIIDAMDIVISIDTSVVHLAGAMGKPTLNLLPYTKDWRWQRNRDDTPWYSTMRLYTQSFRDDWEIPVQRVIKTLKNVAAQKDKTGEINIWH